MEKLACIMAVSFYPSKSMLILDPKKKTPNGLVERLKNVNTASHVVDDNKAQARYAVRFVNEKSPALSLAAYSSNRGWCDHSRLPNSRSPCPA